MNVTFPYALLMVTCTMWNAPPPPHFNYCPVREVCKGTSLPICGSTKVVTSDSCEYWKCEVKDPKAEDVMHLIDNKTKRTPELPIDPKMKEVELVEIFKNLMTEFKKDSSIAQSTNEPKTKKDAPTEIVCKETSLFWLHLSIGLIVAALLFLILISNRHVRDAVPCLKWLHSWFGDHIGPKVEDAGKRLNAAAQALVNPPETEMTRFYQPTPYDGRTWQGYYPPMSHPYPHPPSCPTCNEDSRRKKEEEEEKEESLPLSTVRSLLTTFITDEEAKNMVDGEVHKHSHAHKRGTPHRSN